MLMYGFLSKLFSALKLMLNKQQFTNDYVNKKIIASLNYFNNYIN